MMNDVLERIAKLEAAVERIERRLACGEEPVPDVGTIGADVQAAGIPWGTVRGDGSVRHVVRSGGLMGSGVSVGEGERARDVIGRLKQEMKELRRELRALRGSRAA